jgi:hypothetical protein
MSRGETFQKSFNLHFHYCTVYAGGKLLDCPGKIFRYDWEDGGDSGETLVGCGE